MKRIILCCFALALLAACATGGGGAKKASYPNKITAETQTSFNAADELYKSKRFSDADAAFANFIAMFPYTELTDEARFRRGEIAFVKKNYDDALIYYRQAFSEIQSPSVAPKARFKAAMSLFNLNRPKESLDEIGGMSRRDASPILRMRVDSLGVRASKAAQISANDAIAWNLFLLDDYAESQGVRPTGIPPKEIVDEADALTEVRRWMSDKTVTSEEVGKLPLKQMRGKKSGGYAIYKYALALHTSGDTRAATKQLKAYVSAYAKHENYAAARALLGELGGVIGDGAGIVVGVILPLSGKYGIYGESVFHGIECAVGVYAPCIGPSGMKLVVRDTEVTAGGAVGAVDELAAENVVAIIGPLLSSQAMDVASRAEELKIPLISIAQRDGVAEIGDYVFRNSVSDDLEMATLADYAVQELKLKRYFVLYPGTKKSVEYKAQFTSAVERIGGNVVAAKSYAQRMPEVVDELRGRGAQEFGPQRERGGGEEKSAPEFDLNAGTNYDAVFIPDSLTTAGYMSGMLKGNPQLLGIARWDDERQVRNSGASVEGAVFVDSFYKNAPSEVVTNFVSRYKDAYNSDPTLLEALGFDAMKLVINAVSGKGAVRRDSIRSALARTSGFPGVTGKITFNAQGDAERELWVLRIKDGSIESVK